MLPISKISYDNLTVPYDNDKVTIDLRHICNLRNILYRFFLGTIHLQNHKVVSDSVVNQLKRILRELSGHRKLPPYLSEHCIPVSSADTRRHLRSANRHLLAVPRFRLNTYARRAFSVAGPMAWNSLPDFIRDPASSTDCFRRLLKTYLFARY